MYETKPIETFEVNGCTVAIRLDLEPESPREWSNLGRLVCWHRRYNLGDEQPRGSVDEWFVEQLGERGEAIREECEAAERSDRELQERLWEEFQRDHEIVPLYLYDHGGLSMQTSAFATAWDSGQVGLAYVSHERIREEYGDVNRETIEKARGVLEAEVEVYDAFLRGEAYGFTIERAGEVVDSCWGFIGDLDEVREAATDAATSFPPPKRPVCKECGSPNVRQDAWVKWDHEHQQWKLDGIVTTATCLRCERQTTLEWK